MDYASYHTRHMLQASLSPSAASAMAASPEAGAAVPDSEVATPVLAPPAKLVWILGTRRHLLQHSVHAVRPTMPSLDTSLLPFYTRPKSYYVCLWGVGPLCWSPAFAQVWQSWRNTGT